MQTILTAAALSAASASLPDTTRFHKESGDVSRQLPVDKKISTVADDVAGEVP